MTAGKKYNKKAKELTKENEPELQQVVDVYARITGPGRLAQTASSTHLMIIIIISKQRKCCP